MNTLSFSEEAVVDLVALRPTLRNMTQIPYNRILWCTISPNARAKHKVLGKGNLKMPYGKLPQRIQYEYCIKILKNCYISFYPDCKLFGVPELNKDGNVHLHFLLYDTSFTNEVALQVFRRDVLFCPEVMFNFGCKKQIDYMNNIVFCNKPVEDIIDYMMKVNIDMLANGFYNFYRD